MRWCRSTAATFGLNTVSFRGGCLTGPGHSGAKLHGFLSYLVRCALTAGALYGASGTSGKQVRDNIHAADLVNMFWHYHQASAAAVRCTTPAADATANCSMQEAITLVEQITGTRMQVTYSDENRIGDHIWYVSDTRKFRTHYPEWGYQYDLRTILEQIVESMSARLSSLPSRIRRCPVHDDTILITGGAGFVGSHLAASLKQRSPDSRIVALDNLSRRGSELNIPRLREQGDRISAWRHPLPG